MKIISPVLVVKRPRLSVSLFRLRVLYIGVKEWLAPFAEQTSTMAANFKYCWKMLPHRAGLSLFNLFFNQKVRPSKSYLCTGDFPDFMIILLISKGLCVGTHFIKGAINKRLPRNHWFLSTDYVLLVLRAICMWTSCDDVPAQVRCRPAAWESRVQLHFSRDRTK